MKLNTDIFDKIISHIPIYSYYGDGFQTGVKFVLTGSALLCAYGLMDEFNDVDILVINSNDSYWSDLLSTHNLELGDEDYSCIEIKSGGFVYNIIRDDTYLQKLDGTPISIDGEIFLDSLYHAIIAKKDLQRAKDAKHFNIINDRLKKMIEYNPMNGININLK